MRMGRTQTRLVHEALLALLVLALTFLNFGHSSAVFAAGGRVVVTGTSICGDPLTPASGDHFACHACRPDAVALPPRPTEPLPVVFTAAAVCYQPSIEAALAPAAPLAAAPRGPPRAA